MAAVADSETGRARYRLKETERARERERFSRCVINEELRGNWNTAWPLPSLNSLSSPLVSRAHTFWQTSCVSFRRKSTHNRSIRQQKPLAAISYSACVCVCVGGCTCHSLSPPPGCLGRVGPSRVPQPCQHPTNQAGACVCVRWYTQIENTRAANTTYRHRNHMRGHTEDNFTHTFIFKYTPIQWANQWITPLWASEKCMEIYAHNFYESSIPLWSLWQTECNLEIFCVRCKRDEEWGRCCLWKKKKKKKKEKKNTSVYNRAL